MTVAFALYQNLLNIVDDKEFVRSLYREILLREPEQDGLIANVELLREQSRQWLIQRFLLSDERRELGRRSVQSAP